jgi:transcriptional regulator with XRE-family HTH domain
MSKTARPASYRQIQKAMGERIKWVRELVEPNQSEAARILGMESPSTLNHIEAGRRPINVFQVIEFANRFRCSTDFVLRGLLVAQTDEELALLLAAEHPGLVDQLRRTGPNKGRGQDGDKSQPPTKP